MSKMSKNLIAIALSTAMILHNVNTVVNAFVPTNYKDSKCIDVRDLGEDLKRITKEKSVCGCKTCSSDAMLYGEIPGYIDDLKKSLISTDEDMGIYTQRKINWGTGKYTGFSIVLATDAIAAKFNNQVREYTAPTFKKSYGIIYFVVTSVGALVGVVCSLGENSCEIRLNKNMIETSNTESILQKLSTAIELKQYKNKNFLLVSTNTLPREQGVNVNFGKKDGMEVSSAFDLSEKDFEDLNENKIKPLLTAIENGEYRQYEKRQYGTKFRDVMKGICWVSLAADTIAETHLLLNKGYKKQAYGVLAAGLSLAGYKLNEEKINAILNEIRSLDKNFNFLDIGEKILTIAFNNNAIESKNYKEL